MPTTSRLPLRPVKTVRVFENVCAQIRQQIATGMLKPGDKLPPERELAQEFGVSRPAVREALRALEITGTIVLHKGAAGGAFIREQDHAARLAQSMHEALGGQLRDGQHLREAFEEVLGVVVAQVARRVDASDLATIDSAMHTMQQGDIDTGQQRAAEQRVLSAIAAASGNPVLALLLDSLAVAIEAVTAPQVGVASTDLIQLRQTILEAIRVQDGSAAATAASALMERYANPAATGLFRPNSR